MQQGVNAACPSKLRRGCKCRHVCQSYVRIRNFFAKSHRRPMWAWDDTNLVIQKKGVQADQLHTATNTTDWDLINGDGQASDIARFYNKFMLDL